MEISDVVNIFLLLVAVTMFIYLISVKSKNNDLENYVNLEKITPKDKDLIIMVYLDWAKRHLKSKKFTS